MTLSHPIYNSDALVRNVCQAIGGRMRGAVCRAPAPGKGPRNDSLVVMPNPSVSGGVAVHLHNAPNDVQTCLALKDDWRVRGLIPDTRQGHRQSTYGTTPQIVSDPAQTAREAQRRQKVQDDAKRIWQATAPANGTLTHNYLIGSRGIRIGSFPPSIRFHSKLDYWHDGRCLFTSAAMVCKITNVDTDKAQGVHITYLNDEACKHPSAPDGRARKMRGIAKAGCVRLGNPGPVMAVAEGIESALAFSQLWGTTCDAALSADGLANYTPPNECKGLLICHDNDANGVGRCAGQSLAARMVARGIECAFKPSPAGSDWNDYLQGAVA